MLFLRVFGGVIAGYAVMAILVIAGTFAAGAIFGVTDPGSATTSFLVTNLVISLLSALVGGYVSAWIGGRARLTTAGLLAVLVLVLGFLVKGQSGQPDWYELAIPLIGAVGVVIGGWLRHEPEARTHIL